MIIILKLLMLFFWTINSYADSVELNRDYFTEFPNINQKIIHETSESLVIKAYSPNNLYNALDHKKVSDICKQLSTDHLQDIKLLKELYLSLQELFKTDEWLQNSEKRIDIHNQIKDLSSKIIKAANPDWNQESIRYTINWHLPRKVLFPLDNYIQARKRLNSGYYSLRQHRNSDLSNLLNNQDYVKSIQIEEAQFLNEPNNNISRNLYLLSGMNNPDEIVMSYSKMATVLEVCQFMPKTKFIIRVDYSFDFGIKVNSTKKIFLEIE